MTQCQNAAQEMEEAMKALIVEDDPNLSLLWHDALTTKGHSSQFRETPSRALDLLFSDRFDLVIVDLCINGGTGLEFLQKLDFYVGESPVLIVTGSAAFPNGELFETCASVRAVLRKPVDIESMLDVAEYLAIGGATVPHHLTKNLPIELPN